MYLFMVPSLHCSWHFFLPLVEFCGTAHCEQRCHSRVLRADEGMWITGTTGSSRVTASAVTEMAVWGQLRRTGRKTRAGKGCNLTFQPYGSGDRMGFLEGCLRMCCTIFFKKVLYLPAHMPIQPHSLPLRGPWGQVSSRTHCQMWLR